MSFDFSVLDKAFHFHDVGSNARLQPIFTRFNKLLTNRTRVASSFLSFDFSVLDKAFLFHDVGPNARLQPIDRNDSSLADLVQISAQTAPPRGQKWLLYHRDLSPVDIPVPLGTARLKHCNFVLIQRFVHCTCITFFPKSHDSQDSYTEPALLEIHGQFQIGSVGLKQNQIRWQRLRLKMPVGPETLIDFHRNYLAKTEIEITFDQDRFRPSGKDQKVLEYSSDIVLEVLNLLEFAG